MAPVCPDLLIEIYTFHNGALLGRELFTKPVLILGRDASLADIVLPSTSVSRRHAEIAFDGEQLEIRDRGSRNGVGVNGARVSEAVVGRFEEIQIGEFVLKAKLLLPTAPSRTRTQTMGHGADLTDWDDITACGHRPSDPPPVEPECADIDDEDEDENHEPAYSLVAQLLHEGQKMRGDRGVEVLTFAADTVEGAELVGRGQSFWVGPKIGWLRRSRYTDLQPRHRLLKVTRGLCRVWLNDALRATVHRGGRRVPLVGHTSYELRHGEAIDVIDGARRYHVRFVNPPRRLRARRPFWQRLRPNATEVRAVGGSVGAHLGILVILGLLLPPEVAHSNARLPDEAYRLVSITPEVVEAAPEPVVETPRRRTATRERQRVGRAAGEKRARRLGSSTGGARGILDTLNRSGARHAPGSSVRQAVSNLTFSKAPGGYRVAGLESAMPTSDLGVGGLGGGPGLGITRAPIRDGGRLGPHATRGVGGRVTKVDFKAERPGGCRQDRTEIQRVVNLHIGQVQQCYERELMRHAGLSGKIRIEWVIRTNGTVKSTRQAYSSMDSPAVSRCIMAAIRSWRFRGSDCGEVTVAYPFIFESLSF